MAHFKVIVPRLNVRKAPVADFADKSNIITTVGDGLQLELEEVTDFPTPSLGLWFRDSKNQYYSEKGLRDMGSFSGDTSLIPSIVYPWWIKNNLYSIPELWREKDETKVTIAILDTGISEHIDFDFSRITGFNYLDNSENYKTDDVGHGTHLAGIMVAKGTKSFGVFPGANLFVAKVCDSRGIPNFGAIRQALEDILNNKNGTNDVDVINMSFDLAVGDDTTQIQLKKEIEKLIKLIVTERKCICVAACCDYGLDTSNLLECSPANLEECISVGGLDKNLERDPISNKSINLDIMAPCTDILSSNGFSNVIPMRGTSQSAAFVSGICALGIHKLKNKNSFSDSLIKSLLYKTAKSSSNQSPVEYGHGIINPNLFISSL